MTRSRRTTARAALALSLTLLAGGLAACGGGDGDDTEPAAGGLTALALPGISQQGAEAASADDAQGVVSGVLESGEEGVEVTAERKDGGSWQDAGAGTTDDDGQVEIRVDAKPGATYRLSVDGATSEPVTMAETDWSDEFEDDDIAPNWTVRGGDYNPAGLRRCAKSDASAVEEGGGVLTLSVLDDPAREDRCQAESAKGKRLGDFDYRLNADIASVGRFTYGVFAARLKFQRDPGQHGSFWLQSVAEPGSGTPAEVGAEIDVVEYFGDTADKRLASFIHYNDGDGPVKEGDFVPDAASYLADQDDDWWKAFHVFAVRWTEDEYVVYIDGRRAWSTDQGVSQAEEYMVLSMLSSDYELGKLKGGLPQSMEVDWVRHWPLEAS